MMKKSFFVLFLLGVVLTVFAKEPETVLWGKTGHRVIGEVAQQHLSKKARKSIEKLLDHEGLAFTSTFADEVKGDSLYWKYSPWHYVNFPLGERYEDTPKNPKGDIIWAIGNSIGKLKDEQTPTGEKVFHLKILIHLIGDLHQPLHIGIAEDRGGNDFQVRWYDEGTNLHSMWDTKMIRSYGMSYSELAKNLPHIDRSQEKQMVRGTPLDWAYESRALCEEIYEGVEKGQQLKYDYIIENLPVIRQQLLKGGLRLAHVLNDIFG